MDCRRSNDERVRKVSLLSRLLSRPELGAAAGTVLVFVFFAVVAGGSGLFSAKGIVNFLEVSAQLGILAAPVALLMIAGEFDLSVGSMIGFAGILIAIPAVFWGWPIWLSIVFAFVVCGAVGCAQRARRGTHRAAVLHRDAGQPVHAARSDARRHPRHLRADPGVRHPRVGGRRSSEQPLFRHRSSTVRCAGSPNSA